METSMLDELRQIEEEVTPRRGWDFSRMRTKCDPVPWDYMEIVPRYLKPIDDVLDVGTGGGEKFLDLSRYFARGVGVDKYPEMIRAARDNGASQAKVTFTEMAAEALMFPDASFDVVLTRHAPVLVSEVARVLKPGGYFVVQSVGPQNMANIRREFGTEVEVRDTSLSALADDDHRARIDEFPKHGCDVVAAGAYNVRYWVEDLPSLVFWFKALAGVPEIPEGFSIERDGQIVARIIEKYSTAEGVLTNEHRTLLVVRKRS